MKIRGLIVLVVLGMIAAACGQKPGVHDRGVASGETGLVGSGTGAVFDPTTGQLVDPNTGQVVDPTTGTATGTVPGSVPGTTPTSAPPVAGPGDRTGITDKTITIGLHAPVTGAAPVRSDSFNTGRQLYWDHGNKGSPVKVFGRTVKVLFENDNYNPSTAAQKCKQMAEGGKAFLLVGGAGTDQIQACAKYAANAGIPYLSAGVAQNSLSIYPNYFALSMSYFQQGPVLASYIKKNAAKFGCGSDGCSVAAVVTNTANFDDAVDGFRKGFPSAKIFRPSKSDSGAEWGDELCTGPTKNYEVVFPLTSPTFFLEMSGAPTASCNPQYVGVGISMGLDTVASTGCKTSREAMGGSVFFSPAPAFRTGSTSAQKDPTFAKYGEDDLHWLLWGLMKDLHQMFQKAGPDMSRQSFIQTISSAKISTGVFPDLSYSPSNRFGAKTAWALEAVCEGSGGYYKTLGKVG